MQDARQIVGSAIRKRRVELGLTQEQLAELASLHWTYISGVERGTRNIGITALSQIAGGLSLTVKDLVVDL